jgi:hypothetical protein
MLRASFLSTLDSLRIMVTLIGCGGWRPQRNLYAPAQSVSFRSITLILERVESPAVGLDIFDGSVQWLAPISRLNPISRLDEILRITRGFQFPLRNLLTRAIFCVKCAPL